MAEPANIDILYSHAACSDLHLQTNILMDYVGTGRSVT